MFISFLFIFFFPFEVFQCTKCKFVLVLRFFFFFFFFKHKLHVGQILNFSRYLLKHPEIDQNDPKFFQSGIGTPWTKFLESPLSCWVCVILRFGRVFLWLFFMKVSILVNGSILLLLWLTLIWVFNYNCWVCVILRFGRVFQWLFWFGCQLFKGKLIADGHWFLCSPWWSWVLIIFSMSDVFLWCLIDSSNLKFEIGKAKDS